MRRVLAVVILTVALACLALTHAAADVVWADNSPEAVDDTHFREQWTTPLAAYLDWYDVYSAPSGEFITAAIRFNSLPSIPSADVTNATLRLYCSGVTYGSPGLFTVHEATSDWDEATLTWGNCPWQSAYPHPATNIHSIANAGDWAEVDVTDLVKGWWSGSSPNYGVILEGYQSVAVAFYSSDHTDSSVRPQLKIEYELPLGMMLFLI